MMIDGTADQFVAPQNPFGIRTNIAPDTEGELGLFWRGGIGRINADRVTRGVGMIDQWKVIAPRTMPEHAGHADASGQRRILSRVLIAPPGSVCSESFLILRHFGEEMLAARWRRFMLCKLTRFLIWQATSGFMLSRSSFVFVPAMPVDRFWYDRRLYAFFGMTCAEIAAIERSILAML